MNQKSPPTVDLPNGGGTALSVRDLGYTYPAGKRSGSTRQALRGVSFTVASGELFCVLGPNGSGKSTLFRILTTSVTPRQGAITHFGRSMKSDLPFIRSRIGVVFQNPALDKKLTVSENLHVHGSLYGMSVADIRDRSWDLLGKFGIRNRAGDRVEVLSGGLQRRVELAKSLLHSPRILFLDEPTTGLDPTAREEFITLLKNFRRETGATIVYTTHLLDEAEEAGTVLILDNGEIVALGPPGELKGAFGGELIMLRSRNPADLLSSLQTEPSLTVYPVEDGVSVECENASAMIPDLLRKYGDQVDSVTFSRPSIEDVYIRKTGHRFSGGLP